MKEAPKKLSPEPNAMFCSRLAEIAFQVLEKDQAGAHGVHPGHVHLEDKHFNKESLRQALLKSPKLQQQLAASTSYSPSKWLLEQEMLARSTWTEAKGDVHAVVAEEKNRLMGVCLSGGGTRSATFNLGVIQGLAQLGLIPLIDYLSSVSGGGYIHAFMAGWILRDPQGSDGVIQKLIPQPENGCLPSSPEPIKWLMRYASYMAPKGTFSADSWTAVAIWLRNIILNQVPVFAWLASLFYLVHLFTLSPVREMDSSFQFAGVDRFWNLLWWTGLGVAIYAVISLFKLGRDLYLQSFIAEDEIKAKKEMRARGRIRRKVLVSDLMTNHAVQLWVILPWLVASVWLSFWSQFQFRHHGWLEIAPAAVACVMVLTAVMLVIYAGNAYGAFLALDPDSRWFKRVWANLLICLVGVVSTTFACAIGYMYVHVSWWLSVYVSYLIGPTGGVSAIDPWRIQLVIMPGALLSVPYIAIELTLALLGRHYSDARREWLTRMAAWSLLYAFVCAGGVSIVLLGPYVGYYAASQGPLWVFSSIGTILAAHGVTVLSGWIGKVVGRPSDKGVFGLKQIQFIVRIALAVLVVSLLLFLSYGVSISVDSMAALMVSDRTGWESFAMADLICAAAALMIAILFGWRVDINDFSIMSFYRNRVRRSYIDATLRDRQPNPFIGSDDRTKVTRRNLREQTIPLRVSDLLPEKFNRHEHRDGEYHGPFPIFCTTLNLTTGEDLATQQRKGASFIFTPLYSGYSVSWTDSKRSDASYNGFVPTKDYAYRNGGIHLDTAVAISGAGLGFSCSPVLAFLTRFLNVRLNWWISNPRKKHCWRAKGHRSTPKFPGIWLLQELFGSVNDASRFVKLSDGGQFENLGLYELVRRRCSYIIVCDAEVDEDMTFEGIGTAIAMCRADFGAEIDLDLRSLQIDKTTGWSGAHCVVGTIRYPPPNLETQKQGYEAQAPSPDSIGEAKNDPYTGVIVYLKASMVGDEPADLLAYKLRNKEFPHDVAGNQSFTETQFESYRRLGHHIAISAIQPALSPERDRVTYRAELANLFSRMYAVSYPRSPEIVKYFADHQKQHEGILVELRTHRELAGLEARLNDERSFDDCYEVEWNAPTDPASSHEYAMQFAHSLINFMYTVYTNLQLASPGNRNSPHADWWISLFRSWCRVTLIRKAWLQVVPFSPSEFRLFARRELKLPARFPYVE